MTLLRETVHRYPLWAAAHAGLALLLLFPGASPAQEETASRLLLDPVPILVTPAGEEGGEPRINELASLPKSDKPHRLATWLRSRAQEQREAPSGPQVDVQAYQRSVHEIELAGGAYAPGLAQALLGLGSAHQRQGEHELALEALERAFHVNRINNGLFNLDQTPIVNRMIESHMALGDLMKADEQQEYLFYIQQKAHGVNSPDLLPAMAALADWNIFAFNAQVGWSRHASFGAEGERYQANINNAVGEDDIRTRRLVNAQNLYRGIIQILLRTVGVGDPRLLDMERKLALTNYFFATTYSLDSRSLQGPSAYSMQSTGIETSSLISNSMGYRHGREALERRVDYLRDTPGTAPAEIAGALVELGDWLLTFRKRLSALEIYEEALRAAREAPNLQVVQELFSPQVPVTVPTFLTRPYSREALDVPPDLSLAYKGYIDVAFRIDRYGEARHVEFLGATPNTSEDLKSLLRREIRRAQYRPRFQDGALVEEYDVTLRYYFTW